MPRATEELLRELADGRTEHVFELIDSGCSPEMKDEDRVSLLQRCAYYGDVSAIKFLVSRGAPLASLGRNFDLSGACFHGHWRLCRFLIEQGADVNDADPENGETPLHAALCTTDRVAHDRVLKVLLAAGADPNVATLDGANTDGFMRDARTKGETPLHRAAAFGTEETIRLLLEHGAKIDARDANGDSPLSWGSWYLRPDSMLRMLCFGDFRIRPGRESMRSYLVGRPPGAQ
jgi:ankyrin repeat protein